MQTRRGGRVASRFFATSICVFFAQRRYLRIVGRFLSLRRRIGRRFRNRRHFQSKQ